MPSCHPSVRYPKLYLEPVTALAAISLTGDILRGPNVPAGRTSAAQIRGLGHHRRCVRASERGTTRNTVAATAEASLPLSGRDRPTPVVAHCATKQPLIGALGQNGQTLNRI